MRFHDLHGDGRFSLIEFARSRREREERRAKRRKALSRFGPRRLLAIAAAVARWHLAAPAWATISTACEGHTIRLGWPSTCAKCDELRAAGEGEAQVHAEHMADLARDHSVPGDPYDGVPELPALEALTLARLAALRDGRRSLARVLLDVHLLAVAGREDEVVHLLELMATGTRAQLPCQGERVH